MDDISLLQQQLVTLGTHTLKDTLLNYLYLTEQHIMAIIKLCLQM